MKNSKILFVDDEPDVELLVKQKFRHKIKNNEWEFNFAGNGMEALEMLSHDQYDLVLTDLNMPMMDGLMLLEKLSELEKIYKAVVISAYGDLRNIRMAMNRGAFDFLTKPIDFEDLEKTINKTLNEVELIRDGLEAHERISQMMLEKERAEQSEKFRQEFLANMSHEIRTPMNSIIGFTWLTLKTNLNAEQQKFIKAIQTSSENLLVIINDILDISKIEAGKITFEEIDFNIRNVIATVADMLQIKAAEKNVSLNAEIDKKIPENIVGDPVRLNQILLNLAGNAVKFTEKGEVKITLNLKEEKEDKLLLEFFVKDTGIGIPQDRINFIFESFAQASSDIIRKYGGTGLGLTITKKLVELQGGEIKVQSKPGEGSIFTAVIPYKKFTGEKSVLPAEKREKVLPQSLGKLKVLLVEDNPMNQLLAKTVITQEWGYDIDVAENGRIGVEKIRANDYDVVLMDIQMPEMDGLTATRAVRALGDGKNKIPIIGLTAYATMGESEKCFNAGMNGYISKPFNPQNLLDKIAELVNS